MDQALKPLPGGGVSLVNEWACQGNGWDAVIAALWLAHTLFEYWLGKTQRTKSGSVVELVITGIVGLIVLMAHRRKRGDSEERN